MSSYIQGKGPLAPSGDSKYVSLTDYAAHVDFDAKKAMEEVTVAGDG